MMSAELLGTLEQVVHAAVRVRSTYKKKSNDTHRTFRRRKHPQLWPHMAATLHHKHVPHIPSHWMCVQVVRTARWSCPGKTAKITCDPSGSCRIEEVRNQEYNSVLGQCIIVYLHPGSDAESSFRRLAEFVEQGIYDIADCRVRLPAANEAAAEHQCHAALLDLPVCQRQHSWA